MLIIDGAYGEGGGQILRSALTLSAITGTAVRLENIRAQRSNPGLRPQHLTAVRAAARICNAALAGDTLGSQSLLFEPGSAPIPGTYDLDVTEAAESGSAGAVTLIFQTIFLPLALAPGPSHVTLRGGTCVPWSPPVPYLERVYLPTLARLGVTAHVTEHHWGFYPRGGGKLTVKIAGGATLHGFDSVDRGPLLGVDGLAYASRLPSHIPQRMCDRASSLLRQARLPVQVTPEHVAAADPAAGIFLAARYQHAVAGFSVLGRRGLPSEQVAEMACEAFFNYHNSTAAIGPYLGDQLVLPLVLAGDRVRISVSKVTRHLLTNLWTVGHFDLAPTHVQGEEGEAGFLLVGEESLDD